MSSPKLSDAELLERLLLGQASAAEIEQLSQQYAEDSRLAELAETLANRGDTLLEALHGLRPIDDPEADRLIERLLQRLPSSLVTLTRVGDDTGDGSEADSSAAPIPENLEHFRVQKLLGEGGMGIVYLAYDTRLRREVAVKTLKPALARKTDAKERFLREARTAAALQHDHIIPIHYVGEADGIPFLVMALLKGTSLDELLKQRQTAGETALPVSEALRIARQIAVGLAAAHARGLVHRDIKPSNVWLETSVDQEFGEFRVKLLDFGLARSGEGEDDVQITASGVILGTPAYMAPEQARGQSVDHRCDLFSLGVVLYAMATGRLPFGGNTIAAVLTSLAVDNPQSPQLVNAELPPELSDLIMQLLTKDPAGRPTSAKEVAERLGQIERRLSVAPPVPYQTGPSQIVLDQSEERSPSSAQVSLAGVETAETECLARHAPLVTRRSSRAEAPRRNQRRIFAAVALLILGPLGWLFHGTIFRVVTNQGELVIDVSDPNVDVRVELNDAVIHDKTTQRQFTLTVGKGAIEVLEKDGIKLATKEFELTRGGTTTVKVTWQELTAARQASVSDPNRQAAEYVLSIGGKVVVNYDYGRQIKAVSELPKEAFVVAQIWLTENLKVTDRDLSRFKGCQGLWLIALNGTQITDAGLAHVKDYVAPQVMSEVYLANTSITDSGLAQLADCTGMRQIQLANTAVTDAGLKHLKRMKQMNTLFLHKTRVTEAGVRELAAALPQCEINWDGGKIEPTRAADPDRQAAEYVLSIGARIKIRAQEAERVVDAVAGLPQEPFQLTSVDLTSNQQVTESGLANFKGCKNLTVLNLDDTRVTDAGLANFKDCQTLTHLSLRICPQVTDAGLANFKDCRNLTVLLLWNEAVTDAGLAQFKDWSNLRALELSNTQVTDAGLAAFADCRKLTMLQLGGTKVTDAGLANFKDCNSLTHLNVGSTAMTDAGLAHFRDCKNLTSLYLGNSRVTPAGLAYFKDCRKLDTLHLPGLPISDANLAELAQFDRLGNLQLGETRISLAGYEQLKNVMPRCQIAWSETNRIVAEGVLALGGSLHIGRPGDNESRPVLVVADLPRDYFQVRRVSLTGVQKPLGSLPEHLSKLRFADLDRVESIDLSGTPLPDLGFLTPIQVLEHLVLVKSGIRAEWLVALPKLKRLALDDNPIGGAGLANLANQSELTELTLADAGLTDSDLRRLPIMLKLARLVLDGNEIRGSCLPSLKRQPALVDLSLGCSTLTDLLANNLAELKQIKRLSLAGSGITDASLSHLAGLPGLEVLDLRKTKVTAAAVAELAKALPACKIESDVKRDAK